MIWQPLNLNDKAPVREWNELNLLSVLSAENIVANRVWFKTKLKLSHLCQGKNGNGA